MAATENVRLDENSSSTGKSLSQINLRQKTGASVLAVIKDGETFVNPGGDFVLETGMTLVLVGESENLDAAIQFVRKGSEIEP